MESKRTQAARSAATRAALVAAARPLFTERGYAAVGTDEIARAAGVTRGALYHQFAGKEALVLAAVGWVRETWWEEVGAIFDEGLPPHETLVGLARRHAVYCRRDIAGVMAALRVEFGAREHPIGEAVRAVAVELVGRLEQLIEAGRAQGTIPPGPPARTLASASLSAVEGAVIALAADPRHDEEVAARVAGGLLGAG